MSSSSRPIRWGVAGCGLISSDFVSTIQNRKDVHDVVSVSARDPARAAAFASAHGARRHCSSYAALADDEEVEVVYVGVVSPVHLEVVKMMLQAGKSVLCEKPLALNAKEAREMVSLAREKGKFFMEAIWTRMNPAYRRLAAMLADGTVGEVTAATCSMGIRQDGEDARLMRADTGGGTVLDFGVYCIQLALFLFGAQRPEKIVATSGALNKHGVETGVHVTLVFPGGRLFSFATNLLGNMDNVAFISGTKMTVKMNFPFWCPETMSTSTEFRGAASEEKFPKPEAAKKEMNFPNSEFLYYEAEEVRRCLLEGLTESPLLPLEETVIIAEIQEEIHRQVGVVAFRPEER